MRRRKWRQQPRRRRTKALRRYQLFGTARPITRVELEQLRRALSWRDGLACAIMADTGLRVSDVLAIRREQLAPSMTIREQKTGKLRVVRLSAATYDETLAYLRTTESEMVIDCHRSTLWRAIAAAADAYGWSHVSPHSLRKLFAVEYCARYGLAATQKELQHKNVETTLRYLGNYQEIIAAVLTDLAGHNPDERRERKAARLERPQARSNTPAVQTHQRKRRKRGY